MEAKIKHKHNLDEILSCFQTIGLDEIEQVKLMSRLDSKFILNTGQLQQLLIPLSETYSILKINNIVNHGYSSVYYDTPDYNMYMEHHNKRTNRYKIRQRLYHSTNDIFFEIKFKNNKGITNKSRIKTQGEFYSIPIKYHNFISQNTKYNALMLRRSLENHFHRFTLTNKLRNQRITIDTDISFNLNTKSLILPEIAILEIKSVNYKIDTTIFQLLRQLRISPTRISKYSIGLAMVNPSIKQNLFKHRIYNLKKVSNGNY